MAGRLFKDKYFIKVTAFYNRIIAHNIVPQDIHSTRHIYNLYKIIKMWYIEGRKGLYIEVVIILTEKPVPETTLIYASLYAFSIKAL